MTTHGWETRISEGNAGARDLVAAWLNGPHLTDGTANAWASPGNDLERGMVQMIRGAAAYIDAYRERYESPIGEDAIIGDEGILDILRGLRRLLDGELGRLDAGNLSSIITDLFKVAGYEPDAV